MPTATLIAHWMGGWQLPELAVEIGTPSRKWLLGDPEAKFERSPGRAKWAGGAQETKWALGRPSRKTEAP